MYAAHINSFTQCFQCLHTDAKTVTVVTHPPNGPHLIGSTVNLTCHVQPQPLEEEVTYRWRDYVPYTYPVVANSSLPYATLTIGIGHPHTARYYCQVYYRNVLLATGSTVISVQGIWLHNYNYGTCLYNHRTPL